MHIKLPNHSLTEGLNSTADNNSNAAPVTRLLSRELFGCAREVIIEHEGEIYRLRLTRLGKLILTK